MDPIVIITVAELVEALLPVLPDLVVRENPDGEIVIFTGKQVASSDGHLAPINRDNHGPRPSS